MQGLRPCLGLLGTLTLINLPTPSGAQPVGSEFQINTYTTSNQRTPSRGHVVASDASGNFVVVWESYYQDGSGIGIFGQRYNSTGGTLGSEFRVNSYTTNSQEFPSVASDASGNFVVVWRDNGRFGSNYEIFGQRYDSAGVPRGVEFLVNSFTPGPQSFQSVAADAAGNFVVVWVSNYQDGSSYGIFAQRYDSVGVAQGDEFQTNSYTTDRQMSPSIAADASGNFVVLWTSYQEGGYPDSPGIFGQRYDSSGVAQGEEFHVNSFTTNRQTSPSVAADASGNFVVVWTSYQEGGYPDSPGIFGQRYDSSGVAQGEEFHVNSFTTNRQTSPSVAADASGNFVVVWTSYQEGGYPGSPGIFGQRYDSSGVAQGEEFHVNSFTTNRQRFPSVGAMGTNQFVVAWESNGQDGSGLGVFGQRYNFDGAQAITVVTPNTEVKWRIGALERIQWMHNLGHRATFRIELDRDDDGEYEELIAAGAPSDSTRGSFAWAVTGPRSGTARVRVSWTDDPAVSDTSDVTFQVRPLG